MVVVAAVETARYCSADSPPPTSLEIRRGCSSRGGADIWLGAANFSFLNTPRASLNLISLGV